MRGMSSDGSTDKPRLARPGRGEGRDLASIALGVLLILAVVATVVMVFSDNPVWMRIGTLAALWAAFIGAFLVARYRRQAAAEATRVRDLHTVYELQLEREISARREHELVVEKELRDSIRIETADSVLALRHEIAALREQLGAMGVTLPEDRFAVGGHAPAGQLGAGTLPSVPSERVEPRRRASEQATAWSGQSGRPSSSDSAPVSGFGATSAAASSSAGASAPTGTPLSGVGPDSTPSTERTEKFSPVADRGTQADTPAGARRRPAGRPPAASGRASRRAAETVTPSSPQPSAQARPAAPAQPAAASSTPSPARPSAPAAPAAKPESTSTSRSAESAPAAPASTERSAADEASRGEQSVPSRHGQGSGLSVADLMARLGGDDAPSGGRRRRRAED